MKAALIHEYGEASKIIVADIPKPTIKDDEVLVEIKAAGVNPVDGIFRQGYLGDGTFPLIMGSDFAGIITAIGKAAQSTYAVGDEVYGYKYLGNGTYAEYAAISMDLLARKPKNLSFIEAAAIPCAGLIAYDTIANVLEVSNKDNVLITGGTGGVGSFAIQVARALGAHVVATASTSNQKYLEEQGAVAIDYQTTDYADEVKRLYPNGVDKALSAIPQTVHTILPTVKSGGRLTWITGPDGPKMERMIAGGNTNGSRGTQLLNELTTLIERSEMKVSIDKVFSLSQAIEAQRYVDQGHTKGKVVIDLTIS